MNQPTRRGGANLQTIIGLLAGAYGVSPIDVVPDFIPVVGAADDIAVILLALVAMLLITLADRGGAG